MESLKNTLVWKKMCITYSQSQPNTHIKKSNKQFNREKSIESQLCVNHNKKTTLVIIDLYIKYYSVLTPIENDVKENKVLFFVS